MAAMLATSQQFPKKPQVEGNEAPQQTAKNYEKYPCKGVAMISILSAIYLFAV